MAKKSNSEKKKYSSVLLLISLVVGLGAGILLDMFVISNEENETSIDEGIFNPTIDGEMKNDEYWNSCSSYEFYMNLDEEHEDTKNYIYVNYTENYVYALFDFCGDITNDEDNNEWINMWIDSDFNQYQYEWQTGDFNISSDHYENFTYGDENQELSVDLYGIEPDYPSAAANFPEVIKANAFCRLLDHNSYINNGSEVLAYNLTSQTDYINSSNFYDESSVAYPDIEVMPHTNFMGGNGATGNINSTVDFEIEWSFNKSINSDQEHRIFEIKIDTTTISNFSVDKGIGITINGYGTAATFLAEDGDDDDFAYYSIGSNMESYYLAKDSAIQIADTFTYGIPHPNKTIVEFYSLLNLASYESAYYPF